MSLPMSMPDTATSYMPSVLFATMPLILFAAATQRRLRPRRHRPRNATDTSTLSLNMLSSSPLRYMLLLIGSLHATPLPAAYSVIDAHNANAANDDTRGADYFR